MPTTLLVVPAHPHEPEQEYQPDDGAKHHGANTFKGNGFSGSVEVTLNMNGAFGHARDAETDVPLPCALVRRGGTRSCSRSQALQDPEGHFAGFFGDLRAASSAAAFSACFWARVMRGLGFLVSVASWVSALTFAFAWG